jgi:6-phosphogluconate dehydrogenase (decarboxylating)
MQIGMIGLGRMGANMVRRLMRGGHECVVYNRSPGSVDALAREGAIGAAWLDDFVAKFNAPRTVWLMVPAAVVDDVLQDLAARLQPGDFNLPDIAEVWRRGSVVGSWLLDLAAHALLRDPQLAAFQGRVSASGEGRWTIKAAIDAAVPVPVLSAALYQRFSSRGEDDFAAKLLSAMRSEFGGHAEKASSGGKP